MDPNVLFQMESVYNDLEDTGPRHTVGARALARLRLLGVHTKLDKPSMLLLHVADEALGQEAYIKGVVNYQGAPGVQIRKSPFMPQFLYEWAVYRDAVNPMIRGSECGNLVAMLASFACTLPQLAEWLRTQAPGLGGKRQHAIVTAKELEAMGQVAPASTVRCIMTGVPPTLPGHPIETLDEHIRNAAHGALAGRLDAAVQNIVFQVLYTLHACHARGLMHNDDHLANWLVGALQQGVTGVGAARSFFVVLDAHTAFEVDGSVMPFLFDWDHAYLEAAGPNPLLQAAVCDATGECNTVTPARDTYFVLCSLWRELFGGRGTCAELAALPELPPAGSGSAACVGGFLQRLACYLRRLWRALFSSNSVPVHEAGNDTWPAAELLRVARGKCERQGANLARMARIGIGGVTPGLRGGAACRLLPEDDDLLRIMPSAEAMLRTDMFADMRVDIRLIPGLLARGERVYAPGDVLSTLPIAGLDDDYRSVAPDE